MQIRCWRICAIGIQGEQVDQNKSCAKKRNDDRAQEQEGTLDKVGYPVFALPNAPSRLKSPALCFVWCPWHLLMG
jgi:hypothetical protein